ncbi:DUF3427 domain-containing protein [Sanguibacter sp. HDW7]|nr:DUF3427 domain-containing protein [Sanguibacter sp. HDW7]
MVGLYEEVHTGAVEREFARALGISPQFRPIPEGDVPAVLARHVASVVERRLTGLTAEQQTAIANEALAAYGSEDDVLVALEQLVAVNSTDSYRARLLTPPLTPLSQTALLTNAPGEPSLGHELRSELTSADSVDLLCAFVKFTGIRIIKEQLEQLRDHGIPLRVITTTYMGATDRRALDVLVRELGASVKVSYERDSTRLHAKAWLLKRASGYDTAIIGSSNLSKAALVDGLEWNIRASSVATPALIRKFEATFETYWNDPSFESYDPDVDAEKFDLAIQRASGNSSIVLSGLEVHPRPYQSIMLEALAAERALHDRHRNLLVAATGTGKTVVAALDYKSLCEGQTQRPTLLFVAHRREILQQSLRTFREVLGDPSFGELMVDGIRPSQKRHVFASIQSLAAALDLMPADAFDVVIVDEFHHAAAPSYRTLLEELEPKELLGLTATPERTDGFDVRSLFGDRAAYELRLWDALDQDLLCPFHYYGIADDVDLSRVEWKRGGYAVADLDRVYTGNDARSRLVLRALADRVADPTQMRAIGFCVSVAHAAYMTSVFTSHGIVARTVVGDTPREERAQALNDLRDGAVQIIFTVDVFNEGVDVPSLDTVLLLRPTESATLFQQQLGRGLRRSDGKALLTVLDFIGQQHREFRFVDKFRAMASGTAADIERQVDEGFGYLPSGSQIALDHVSRQIILDNIKSAVRGALSTLAREIKSAGDVDLADYLAEYDRSVTDIYSGGRSWTSLRRRAEIETSTVTEDEPSLLSKMWRFAHVDDPERAAAYRLCATPGGTDYDHMTGRQQLYAAMLVGQLWPGWRGVTTVAEGIERLRATPIVADELRQLIAYTSESARRLTAPLERGLEGVPLFTHATYTRDEILIATRWAELRTGGRTTTGSATGVLWVDEIKTDLFFVTLQKDQKEFSPQTMYRDFPISQDLFHWESQNRTAIESAVGQRYVNHASLGTRVVIFTRLTKNSDLGQAATYVCLGTVSHVDHRGSRPISITWKLDRAMPASILGAANVVGA